ncbi:MAG TPA: lipid-A-disaccharide synthase [Nitrospirota bacterium]|nr:lipid-A-disaccharide synthase [Nitrospirota bacterium]
MKKVLIIAGEASGDLHAAALVRAVSKQDPSIAFHGVGGTRMREAGVSLLADASEISVVGITEVLTHVGSIYRVYARIKDFLRSERPDLLILVDFPDFNLLVGKAAKKLNIPIVYYISPQVWAWRKGRIKTIAKLVKTMLVVFPFEVDLYRQAGVDARFVGHPLIDSVRSELSIEEARRRLGLDPRRRTVAILPGSRKKEIDTLLEDMLGAVQLLAERHLDLQFVLPVAPTITSDYIRSFTERCPVPVRLSEGNVYDVLRASDAAIVVSGTATLETGLMGVPMVIIYRVSRLTAFLVKMLATYDHVGLVNIVANRRIVPELVQEEAAAGNIAAALSAILSDPGRRSSMKDDLAALRSRLGDAGASRRAAEIVIKHLGGIR